MIYMHAFLLFYKFYMHFIRFYALVVMLFMAFTSCVMLHYTFLQEDSLDELMVAIPHLNRC